MNIEFWARPDRIFVVPQHAVEDLAFCTTEEAAGKVFLSLACKVPVIWWGHVWSESIRWVGSGISAHRPDAYLRQVENFAPFATVSKTADEVLTEEEKDAQAGVNLAKSVGRNRSGHYTGRTYPVYNR